MYIVYDLCTLAWTSSCTDKIGIRSTWFGLKNYEQMVQRYWQIKVLIGGFAFWMTPI